MSDFANTLKRIRFERGMTQEELAQFLGTSKQNISRYENGEVSPKISTAAKMAERLGISIAQLNGDEDKANRTDDDDIMELSHLLHQRPALRALLNEAKKASNEDILRAISIIFVLKTQHDTAEMERMKNIMSVDKNYPLPQDGRAEGSSR